MVTRRIRYKQRKEIPILDRKGSDGNTKKKVRSVTFNSLMGILQGWARQRRCRYATCIISVVLISLNQTLTNISWCFLVVTVSFTHHNDWEVGGGGGGEAGQGTETKACTSKISHTISGSIDSKYPSVWSLHCFTHSNFVVWSQFIFFYFF